MGQPIKKDINKKPVKIKKQTTRAGRIRAIRKKIQAQKTEEFGTSKLEEKFAHDFLDKLGVEYVYQYKAASIGRYFDFYLPQYHVMIETDGDYYHSYGVLEENMNKMQKHNKMVDEVKNKWCSRNGIPLIRIWEHDIHNNPKKVLDFLKEFLHTHNSNMGQRH